MARKSVTLLMLHSAFNALSTGIYCRSGINLCRPHQVYAIITNRCDARCRMCPCWRKEPGEELDAEKWCSILEELKRFSGAYHVNFSGGEPFLRSDLFEILRFCAGRGILCGITTNARSIDRTAARELVDMGLFNINISLDSTRAELHDRIRGLPGLFDRVMDAFGYLKEAQKETGKKTHLIIKPTIMKDNFREMRGLASLAKELSLKGVNFQPLFRWTENYDQFRVDDPDAFSAAIDEVIALKKEGWPILNAVSHLEAMKIYYRAPAPEDRRGDCHVGLHNFCIKPNGDVYLCYDYPSIGNVRELTVRELWSSPQAAAQRRRMRECRALCLATCQVKRTLAEKMDLLKYFLSD